MTYIYIYICTEQLYLTKYHISKSKSISDGGHFELQNGGYTQIIYIYIYIIYLDSGILRLLEL